MIGGRLVRLGELPDIVFPNADDGWDVAQAAVVALIILGLALLFFMVKQWIGQNQLLGQVKNGHPKPLRDDIDARFTDLDEKLGTLVTQLGGVAAQVGLLTGQVGGMQTALADHGDRINSMDEYLRAK